MSGYAAPDYEPTAAEIDEFFDLMWSDTPLPGQHGEITIIPAYERYIWQFPVFWGHREVDAHGHIRLAWCVPQPCPKDEE